MILRPLIFLFLFAPLLSGCNPAAKTDAGENDPADSVAAIAADGPMIKADDPPAPEGWTAQPGVTATKYQDGAIPLNVFRLYQPAQTDMAIEDWFEGRRRTLPAGISKPRFVDEIIIESGFYTGYARAEQAGAPIAVISYACKAGGGIRFGELVTSQEDATAQPAAAATLRMMVDLCRDAIAESSPVATAQPGAADSDAADNPDSGPDASVDTQKAPAAVNTKRALGNGRIEAALYTWREYYVGADYKVSSDLYLLLKDGSARRGLPSAAPADFDMAADRAQNSKLWTKWRKRDGGYEFAESKGGWDHPPKQELRGGGKKGLRLNSSFKASDSSNYGSIGSWSEWGLQLNKDGTFRQSSSGGAGGTTGDGGTTTSTTYSDEGSEYAVSTPSGGGGGSSKTGVTDADRTGTYVIDDYTLTLKYNSGRIKRSFFYVSKNGRHIWFEGRDLFIQD